MTTASLVGRVRAWAPEVQAAIVSGLFLLVVVIMQFVQTRTERAIAAAQREADVRSRTYNDRIAAIDEFVRLMWRVHTDALDVVYNVQDNWTSAQADHKDPDSFLRATLLKSKERIEENDRNAVMHAKLQLLFPPADVLPNGKTWRAQRDEWIRAYIAFIRKVVQRAQTGPNTAPIDIEQMQEELKQSVFKSMEDVQDRCMEVAQRAYSQR